MEPGHDLTPRQALALWELLITGDGQRARKLAVKLNPEEVKALESAGLITVERSKLRATDAGWAWGNGPGLTPSFASCDAAAVARVFEALLVRVGEYLRFHDVPLAYFVRPRRPEPEPGEASPAAQRAQGAR